MALINELLGGDIGEVNLTEAEEQMSTHGAPPPGIYHAVLDGAGAKTFDDGTTVQNLTFKIIGGPHTGKEVKHTMWPANNPDEKLKAKEKQKNAIVSHRLGLVRKVKGADGKEKTELSPGKSDFTDCIGVPCFINVKNKEETFKGKKGDMVTIQKAVLDFEALVSPDDKKVKDVVLGKVPKPGANGTGHASGGAGGSNGAASGSTTTKKQQDFSDL